MAIIYLRHPVHGSKVANMESEATYDESNGWRRYDPNEVVVEPVATPVATPVAEPANALAAAREPAPEPAPAKHHPLDHDGDGKPGGSLPGPRRRRTPAVN